MLKAEITNGRPAGDRIIIPKIALNPSDSDLPFKLTRTQFPVRACSRHDIRQFANLQKVKLFLPALFSHGQVDVALSRVGAPDRLVSHAEGHSPSIEQNELYVKNVRISQRCLRLRRAYVARLLSVYVSLTV